MPVVKSKPTSPGRRFVVKVVNPELHKGAPYAPLGEAKSKTWWSQQCRAHYTSSYVVVGINRNTVSSISSVIKDGIPAMVERLEYDPNRTANIALAEICRR